MKAKFTEEGAVSGLAVSLGMAVILLVGSVGFGAWAFVSRQDYKNNSDEKAAQAAEIAAKQTASDKDNEFIEKEKEPLKRYEAPSDLGALAFSYPKTWSGYVDISESEGEFIFHPNVVNVDDQAIYALRVSVVNGKYQEEVAEFDSVVEEGKAKATVYKLPKLPKVVGVRINGMLEEGKQGSMIILPLRDKTLKISTENQDFLADFNKFILPSFTYSP